MSTKTIKQKGFTLVELLVVLAIIGLLVAIGLPLILNAQRASRNTVKLKQLEAVVGSVSDYATRYNVTPYVIIINSGTCTAVASGDTANGTGSIACIKSGAAADPRAMTVTANNNNTFAELASCTTGSSDNVVRFFETTTGAKQLALCNEGGGQQEIVVN